MIYAPPVAESSAAIAIDTLSVAQKVEPLPLHEESDWPIPERELEELSPRGRVDLNTASEPELRVCLGLPTADIDRILSVRDSLGLFRSQRDLRLLGSELHQALMKLRGRFRLSRAPPSAAIRLRASLSGRAPDERPWPSPWKTYLRSSLGPLPGVRVGFLGEKDAGEPYRYAFASAYLMVERLGPLERLILGDFTLHAGQGLILGRGRGFRREFPVRESALLAPHTYADESGYFRGAALTSHAPGLPLRWTIFYSTLRRAASLDAGGAVTDLDETGLFRTPGEQAVWGGVRETTIGSLLRAFPHRDLELGAVIYRTGYSPSLLIGEDTPTARIEGVSLHGRARLWGSSLECEIARTYPGGMAVAACWTCPLGNGSRFLMALRHYAPLSGGHFSSPPGTNGASENEQGVSLSAEISPLKGVDFVASLDLSRELWRTIRTPMARCGAENIIKVRMRVSPGTECSLRWRWVGGTERMTTTDEFGRSSWELIDRQRQSLQLALLHAPGSIIATGARIELVEVRWQGRSARQRGWLLSQAITLRPHSAVSIVARIAIVRTGSYAARIYLPEHDHNGWGAFVMLYGSGVRYSLFVRVAVSAAVRLSAKYASSFFDPPPDSDYPPGVSLRSSLISVQVEGSW